MRAGSVGFAAIAVAACTEVPTDPVFISRPDIRAVVTSEIRPLVDGEGQFLSQPAEAPPFEIISPEEATALARAQIRMAGVMFAPWHEKRLGETVPMERLEPVGTPILGQTPYAPLPATIPAPYQRVVGPHYIVYIGDGSRIWMTVAVSALNHHLELVSPDMIQYPIEQGNEFFPEPATLDGTPLTAEQAALTAAERTGALVGAVPRFLLPPRPFIPQLGVWEVRLDRAVRVRMSEGSADVETVYVGIRGQLFVPHEDQLPTRPLGYVYPDRPGHLEVVQLERHVNRPIHFREVWVDS
jgi:hypothetical protein